MIAFMFFYELGLTSIQIDYLFPLRLFHIPTDILEDKPILLHILFWTRNTDLVFIAEMESYWFFLFQLLINIIINFYEGIFCGIELVLCVCIFSCDLLHDFFHYRKSIILSAK